MRSSVLRERKGISSIIVVTTFLLITLVVGGSAIYFTLSFQEGKLDEAGSLLGTKFEILGIECAGDVINATIVNTGDVVLDTENVRVFARSIAGSIDLKNTSANLSGAGFEEPGETGTVQVLIDGLFDEKGYDVTFEIGRGSAERRCASTGLRKRTVTNTISVDGDFDSLSGLTVSDGVLLLEAKPGWLKPNWHYRKNASVTNPYGQTLASHTGSVTVPKANTRADCLDVRVYEGSSELKSQVASTSPDCELEFNYSINSGQSKTFTVWYGNPDTSSDGEDFVRNYFLHLITFPGGTTAEDGEITWNSPGIKTFTIEGYAGTTFEDTRVHLEGRDVG